MRRMNGVHGGPEATLILTDSSSLFLLDANAADNDVAWRDFVENQGFEVNLRASGLRKDNSA